MKYHNNGIDLEILKSLEFTKLSVENSESFTENAEILFKLTAHIMDQIEKLPAGVFKSEITQVSAQFSAIGLAILINKINDQEFEPFEFLSLGTKVNVVSEDSEVISVADQDFSNDDPNKPRNCKYTKTAEFEETFTFGFTEGIKLGASAEVGFDIGLVNGKASVSTEINFEANQSKEKRTMLSDEISLDFELSPCKTAKVDVMITKDVFKGNYIVSLKPQLTADFKHFPMYKSIYGEKTLEEIFEGLDITINQKGIIDGVVGFSWDTRIGAELPNPACI